MIYMLDTNICIYAIKRKPETVFTKMKSLVPYDLCISSITLAELEYGAAKSQYSEKSRTAIVHLLSNIPILPFDDRAAMEYGNIRAHLEKQGTPIGPLDMLIAAHARAARLTVVTNNVREFERVPGLKIENWASGI